MNKYGLVMAGKDEIMIKVDHGRKYVEVCFFDGIYECIWRCYPIKGGCYFRILELLPDGETNIIRKPNKATGEIATVFDSQTALTIMEQTENLDVDDVLFIINHGGK